MQETTKISEEQLEENQGLFNATAEKVKDCVLSSQEKIYIIHGANSERLNKEYLPKYFSRECYLPPGQGMIIDVAQNISIILSGLINNEINVFAKINHCLLRCSNNSSINFNQGTISGIDIIKSSNININTPTHNYTSLEYNENVSLFGLLDDSSMVRIISCLLIRINHDDIMSNYFTNLIYTKDGYFHGPFTPFRHPLLTIHC